MGWGCSSVVEQVLSRWGSGFYLRPEGRKRGRRKAGALELRQRYLGSPSPDLNPHVNLLPPLLPPPPLLLLVVIGFELRALYLLGMALPLEP
jgi:hypothetical protein